MFSFSLEWDKFTGMLKHYEELTYANFHINQFRDFQAMILNIYLFLSDFCFIFIGQIVIQFAKVVIPVVEKSGARFQIDCRVSLSFQHKAELIIKSWYRNIRSKLTISIKEISIQVRLVSLCSSTKYFFSNERIRRQFHLLKHLLKLRSPQSFH